MFSNARVLLAVAIATAMAVLPAACRQEGPRQPEPEPGTTGSQPVPSVAGSAGTPAVPHGSPVNAAFWADPSGAGEQLVLAAAGIAGVEIYLPDGTRAGSIDTVDAGLVTVVPDVAGAPLVVLYDTKESTLRAFRLERERLSLREVMSDPPGVADELTGLCHYRSRLSGSDYLYAVTDGGMIHHFELYGTGDALHARLLRSIPSGKGSGFCVVDPGDAMLYVSEEATGIWRLGAEPESDTTREAVDLRAPFGSLGDDLKGVAIYPVDSDSSYLVVADASQARLAFYRLPEGEAAGSVVLEGLHEPEGVTVTSAAVGGHASGMLVVADESAEAGGPNLELVGWQAVADALGLEVAAGPPDYDSPPVVRPVLETDVMPSYGDAADDPAIWVHSEDPAQSLVIGTDKQSGLLVYDLEGALLQHLPDGNMNNVDLRDGFPLGGQAVTLVTASNRSNDGIAAYRIDAVGRRLVEVADGVLPTGFADPYGLCMYRSEATGEFYVFVNEGGRGTIRQWRLFDNAKGKVAIEQMRELEVGSQAEGCAADDATGQLYVAEEDRGLWKYSAEPDGGDARNLIDATGDEGRLTDDVEGVAIWADGDGSGYIVVSNQGADNYALYRRGGRHEFVGFVHVVANAVDGIDGASETDGLDVVSASLGAAFPQGLLVVQDGRNIAPEQRQNFKYVSWADVATALDLE